MKNKWTLVSHKLPEVGVWVEVKRDLSAGIGGFTGRESLEWVTIGRYRKWEDMVQWTVKYVEKLDFNNSRPTHWRIISK